MRYTTDFIIPANTLKDDPYKETVKLDVGVIKAILIRFRNGCNYRVALTIFDASFQIVPASPDEFVYGNDVIFEIPMNYKLPSAPYELTLVGWSDGTEFDHCVTVMIDVDESAIKSSTSTIENLAYLQE